MDDLDEMLSQLPKVAWPTEEEAADPKVAELHVAYLTVVDRLNHLADMHRTLLGHYHAATMARDDAFAQAHRAASREHNAKAIVWTQVAEELRGHFSRLEEAHEGIKSPNLSAEQKKAMKAGAKAPHEHLRDVMKAVTLRARQFPVADA